MPLVELRLLEAHTGRRLAGRVAVTADGGRFIPAVGQQETFAHNLQGGHPRIAGEYRYTHLDGHAEFHIPDGPFEVEALRGMEYEVFRRKFPHAPRRPLEIRLSRWCDPTADGWYGGEGHAHYLPPDEALSHGDVEGLEVLAITQQNDMADYENPDYFRDQPPDRPRPACRTRYVEEYRTGAMHVLLYDLKSFIGLGAPPPDGVGTEATVALLAAKSQGAVTVVAHFALTAQLSMLHALAYEGIDAIEILGTSIPTRPFINGRESFREGDVITPLHVWYRLLNLGLRLPVTAGTDRMSNEMTTGAHRTYVHCPGLSTFRQWARGIKAGRTLVTNGPQIRLTVNGKGPGDTVRLRRRGTTLVVTARAWSQFPIDWLELVRNGQAVHRVKVEPASNAAEMTCEVPADRTGWLAARVYEDDAAYLNQDPDYHTRWHGILTRMGRYFAAARPEPAFAHTSPVYISVPGTVSHSFHDRQFFEDWAGHALAAVRTQSARRAEEVKLLVVEYEKAAEILRRRLLGSVGSSGG